MKLTTQKTKLASLILLGISSSALAAPEFWTLPDIKREQGASNVIILPQPEVIDNGNIVTDDYSIICSVKDSAGADVACAPPAPDGYSVTVAAVGEATITWTARLGDDEIESTQKVTVSAESDHEIVAPPFTLLIESADDTVDATSLTAADLGVSTKDDNPNITFSHKRTKETDKALGAGEYVFQWSAEDGFRNAATNDNIAQKVTIKVKAEGETAVAPSFKAELPPRTFFDYDSHKDELEFISSSSNEIKRHINSGSGIKSIDYEPKNLLPGSHYLKWTVTNTAGLKASATQLINILDTSAPEVPTAFETKVIEATSVLTRLDNLTIPATDNVAGDITASLVENASKAAAVSYESGAVNNYIADSDKQLIWHARDENKKLTGRDDNVSEVFADIVIKPIVYLPLSLDVEKKAGNKIRLPITGSMDFTAPDLPGQGLYSYLSNSAEVMFLGSDTAGDFLELDIDASTVNVGDTITVTIDELYNGVYVDGADPKQIRTLTLNVIATPAASTPELTLSTPDNSNRLDVLQKNQDIDIVAELRVDSSTTPPTAPHKWSISPTTNVALTNDTTARVTINVANAVTDGTKYTLTYVSAEGTANEKTIQQVFYVDSDASTPDDDGDGIPNSNDDKRVSGFSQFTPFGSDYITTSPAMKLTVGSIVLAESGFGVVDTVIDKSSITIDPAKPTPHKGPAAKTFSVALSGVSGNAQFVVPLSKDVKVTAKPTEDDAGVAAKNDAIVTELMKLGTDGNFAAFDTTEDSIVYLKADGHCPLIGSKAWTDAQKDDAEAPEMANCALITVKDNGANDLDSTTGRVDFAGEIIGDVNEAPVIDETKVAENIAKAESLLPDRIQVNKEYTVDMSDVVTDANGIQDPAKAADDDANKGKDKITYGLVVADVMVKDPAGGDEKLNLKPSVDIRESDETPGKFTFKVTEADTNSVLDLWVTATDGREQDKKLVKLTSFINLAPDFVIRAFKPEGKPGETVMLVAQEPNDPDGDNSNLTYKWTHIDTKSPITIEDSDKAEASFKIPNMADGSILKMQVEVTDKDSADAAKSATTTKVVEVRVNNRKPGDDDGSMFAFLPALLGLIGIRRRKVNA